MGQLSSGSQAVALSKDGLLHIIDTCINALEISGYLDGVPPALFPSNVFLAGKDANGLLLEVPHEGSEANVRIQYALSTSDQTTKSQALHVARMAVSNIRRALTVLVSAVAEEDSYWSMPENWPKEVSPASRYDFHYHDIVLP